MRTRRGMALIELLAGLSLMLLTLGGVVSLTIGGLKSFSRTNTGIDLSEGNARSMRRVTETLRQAMGVTVLENGARIQYQMPTFSATADPITRATASATRSLTVTLMTKASTTSGTPQFWRLKNTVLLRNAR